VRLGDGVYRALVAMGDEVTQPLYVGWLRAELNAAEDYTTTPEERAESRAFLVSDLGQTLALVAAWVCGLTFVRWRAWAEEVKDRWERLDREEVRGLKGLVDGVAQDIREGRLSYVVVARSCGVCKPQLGKVLRHQVRVTPGIAAGLRASRSAGSAWGAAC
jgi:hypothetical protein